MEDFRNSVAHLDTEVSTEVSVTSVVGENFWRFLYVSNETGITPSLVTKDTYVSIVDALPTSVTADKKALMKKNMASLFEYASGVSGYLISASDYDAYKFKAYWCYLEAEYEVESENSTYQPTTKTSTMLTALDDVFDSNYSQAIIDVAIPYTAVAEDTKATALFGLLNLYSIKLGVYARGANTDLAWNKGEETSGVTVGYSPAMYQLGRTLSFINASGTPIGNSTDTVQCSFQDVLLTRSVSTSELVNPNAIVIAWLQNNRIAYFKTVGDGTSMLALYGGWTIKGSAQSADWIVAYVNYMTKISCAQIMTAMNTFKSSQTYGKMLSAMEGHMTPFIALGRVVNYKVTAPGFNNLPVTKGSNITVPNAWEGTYVDNVRTVKIQGSLTVNA